MRVFASIALGVAWSCICSAGPSRIDPSFNVTLDGKVLAMALQPDKRILIGGSFKNVNGVHSPGLARLHPDGSLDASFNAALAGGALGTNDSPSVRSVWLHTNGQVFIRGSFITVSGVERRRLARLNPDGSLDPTFNPDPRYSPQSGLVVQPDGKVIFGGYQGVSRLNVDGSRDTNFINPRITRQTYVFAVALQEDGKILIGGDFYTVNDAYRETVARLHPDGTLDTTFDTSRDYLGTETRVLIPMEDGSVFIAGKMSAKLRPNGKLASDYQYYWSPYVWTAVLASGKPLLGGDFRYQGVTNLIRLTVNGEIDPAFQSGSPRAQYPLGVDTVAAMCLQPDGRLLVGGNFKTYDGQPVEYLVRLFGDQPTLQQTRNSSGELIVNWSSEFRNWKLQGSDDVTGSDWMNVPNKVIVKEGQCFVTNSASSTHQFFRLIGP